LISQKAVASTEKYLQMTETMSFCEEGRSANVLVELTSSKAPDGKFLRKKALLPVANIISVR